MRPVWFEFPEAEALYSVQDQFMLGPALLAAPVLQEGAALRAVLLPQQATWFDAATGAQNRGTRVIHQLIWASKHVCLSRSDEDQWRQLLGHMRRAIPCMCACRLLGHVALNARRLHLSCRRPSGDGRHAAGGGGHDGCFAGVSAGRAHHGAPRPRPPQHSRHGRRPNHPGVLPLANLRRACTQCHCQASLLACGHA